MNKQLLLDNLRCIPDWPIKGVNFRDVTTLFKDKDALREIADSMYDLYKDKGITKIVGICRKPGKLPCATIQESYAKEYGIDTIEIHADSINEKDVVLLHDDLLATGGTMAAACKLVKKFHPKKIYCNFIIDLKSEFPDAIKQFEEQGIEVTSLLSF